MPAELIPSLLEKNPSRLQQRLKELQDLTDWVHLDICDGIFVSSRTVALEKLRSLSFPPNVELHLMVHDPQLLLEKADFVRSKRVVIHPGPAGDGLSVIRTIQNSGAKAGLALEYMTNTHRFEDALREANFIVVMPIHAGRQGQQFHPEALQLIRKVRSIIPRTPIEVDGAMNPETIPWVIEAGASIINVGSYLWGGDSLEDRWRECQAVIR